MSQSTAAATAAATARTPATIASRRCVGEVAPAASFSGLGVVERLLQRALGPRELEGEQREPDRDDHEGRPGQDEQDDPAEGDHESRGDDEHANRLGPPQMTRSLGPELERKARLGTFRHRSR